MAHIYNSQLDAYTLYHIQHEEHTSNRLISPALPALGHAIAGSTGTAISNLCIYPLGLIITRLQVQRQLRKSYSTPDVGEYEGVFDAAYQIYNHEGGLTAFYTGVVQDTGKSIIDSFLFFLFYNYLRQKRLQRNGATAVNLSALNELAVGAIAGACSKFFTTPIATVVTRKQTASMISARSSTAHDEPSVSDIFAQIRSEKGLQGLWSGYSASLVLTLNPSLTFFLFETFKRTLLPRATRDDPGARITFIMAAISKAVASAATYPFSLAKTRAQVGPRSSDNPLAASTTNSRGHYMSPTSNASSNERPEDEDGKSGKEIKRTSVNLSVFTAIVQIYKTEGLKALYEGIWGEIFKGFFSHGITMLVKEAVHKVIIQLYFILLRALKRMPGPGAAVEQAQEATQNVKKTAREANSRAGEMASGAYGKASESASRAYNRTTERATSAIEFAKEQLGGSNNQPRGGLHSGDHATTKEKGTIVDA